MGLLRAFSQIPQEPTRRQIVEIYAMRVLMQSRTPEWRSAATLTALSLAILGSADELYAIGEELATVILMDQSSDECAHRLVAAYPGLAKKFTLREGPGGPIQLSLAFS